MLSHVNLIYLCDGYVWVSGIQRRSFYISVLFFSFSFGKVNKNSTNYDYGYGAFFIYIILYYIKSRGVAQELCTLIRKENWRTLSISIPSQIVSELNDYHGISTVNSLNTTEISYFFFIIYGVVTRFCATLPPNRSVHALFKYYIIQLGCIVKCQK